MGHCPDNDPKHTDKAMKLMKELCRNRIHSHPANSPYLNVMEDAWSYLDRMQHRDHFWTQEETQEAVDGLSLE